MPPNNCFVYIKVNKIRITLMYVSVLLRRSLTDYRYRYVKVPLQPSRSPTTGTGMSRFHSSQVAPPTRPQTARCVASKNGFYLNGIR